MSCTNYARNKSRTEEKLHYFMDYWTRKYTPPSTASTSIVHRSKLKLILNAASRTSLHSQERVDRITIPPSPIKPFIDMNKVVDILTKPQDRKARVSSLTEEDERVLIKSYWRQLDRWQAFDDYTFLRDPNGLRETKGVDSIASNDIVEPVSFSATINSMEFETVVDDFLYQQRKLQIDKIQEAYSVGTVNQLKFNSALYQREFLEQESPCIPRQRSSLMVSQRVQKRVREVQQLLLSIQARLMKETVECIAPLTEKMVHLLWKIGIFNFFAIGMFIHCQILEMHHKYKQAYPNWKRYIKICNQQGGRMHKYKLVAYKHISKIYITQQNYSKALIYLRKMLKLSWTINEPNFEILAYDLISISFYRLQDIERASFFHEKFTLGEIEPRQSAIRQAGETRYLFNSKLKEHLSDQASFSDDDFDFDQLIHFGKHSRWESQQKHKELSKFINASYKRKYEGGPLFSRIKRSNDDPVDKMNCHSIVSKYVAKQVPYGPLNRTQSSFNLSTSEVSTVQYYISPKHNKVLESYLCNKLITIKDNTKLQHIDSTSFLKMMLRVFQYDIKFQTQHHHLFRNGVDNIK